MLFSLLQISSRLSFLDQNEPVVFVPHPKNWIVIQIKKHNQIACKERAKNSSRIRTNTWSINSRKRHKKRRCQVVNQKNEIFTPTLGVELGLCGLRKRGICKGLVMEVCNRKIRMGCPVEGRFSRNLPGVDSLLSIQRQTDRTRCLLPLFYLSCLNCFEHLRISLKCAYLWNFWVGILHTQLHNSTPLVRKNHNINFFCLTCPLLGDKFLRGHYSDLMKNNKNNKQVVKSRNCYMNNSLFEQPPILNQSDQNDTRPTTVEETMSSGASLNNLGAISFGLKKNKGKGKMIIDMSDLLAQHLASQATFIVVCLICVMEIPPSRK